MKHRLLTTLMAVAIGPVFAVAAAAHCGDSHTTVSKVNRPISVGATKSVSASVLSGQPASVATSSTPRHKGLTEHSVVTTSLELQNGDMSAQLVKAPGVGLSKD